MDKDQFNREFWGALMELVGVIEYGGGGKVHCASILQADVVNTLIEGLPPGRFILTLPVEAIVDQPNQYWVDNGQVVPRVEMAVAITAGVGQVTLSGLPAPCTVSVLGISEQSVDGQLLIEFDEPGDYIIYLECASQYLSKTIEVTIP